MTRTRTLYLIIAVILALLAAVVARNTYWDEVDVYEPPKGEAATDPYYATRKLLGRLGVSLRDISSLRTLPPRDGVLIIEYVSDIELREHGAALRQWVESGGRLVVPAAAIFDNDELQQWTGIEMGPSLPEGEREKLRKVPCQTLDVREHGELTGEKLRVCVSEPETGAYSKRIPTWSVANAAGLQLLRTRIGAGSVTVLDCDCLLKNGKILREDHARLLVRAVPLHRGDVVLLQQAADSESLLALLWRLARPALLATAAVIVLLIWRHWPRFGPPEPVPAPVRRSLAEQIRANAQFAWRTRQLASLRNVMRKAVDRLARRRITGYQRQDSQRRFAALEARTGLNAAALRAAMTDDAGGDAASQAAVIELLERARRALEAR